MLTKSHDTRYFDRMASSLGDKRQILELVKSGRVLDVGAGGGDLSEVLRLAGNEVWAVDGSEAAIERMNERYPEVNTTHALVADLLDHYEVESFDSIVCSSILHEVFSYSETPFASVVDAMIVFKKLLKPSGRLVIRDGVMPTDWLAPTQIRFKSDDVTDFLAMYEVDCPFYDVDGSGYQDVYLERVGVDLLAGTRASVMEFLYTYTWGWGSAEREVQELYGIMTEEQYVDLLGSFDFKVLSADQYLQPGYPENLKKVVDILDDEGNQIEFPSSNMVIVAEKF